MPASYGDRWKAVRGFLSGEVDLEFPCSCKVEYSFEWSKTKNDIYGESIFVITNVQPCSRHADSVSALTPAFLAAMSELLSQYDPFTLLLNSYFFMDDVERYLQLYEELQVEEDGEKS